MRASLLGAALSSFHCLAQQLVRVLSFFLHVFSTPGVNNSQIQSFYIKNRNGRFWEDAVPSCTWALSAKVMRNVAPGWKATKGKSKCSGSLSTDIE